MAGSILSPASPVLPNTAAFIALFPTFAGLAGLIRPVSALALFDIETPSTANELKLASNLMRLFGIRDIFLGLSTLAVWHSGNRKTLGWLCLLAGGVTAVDGIVQKELAGFGEWKHWGFVPVMAGIAAGLLGWLDHLKV